MSNSASLIYKLLVQRVASKKVVTYGEVSEATGVPLGVAGGAVAKSLYEIFKDCDTRMLPPISVIVVQGDNLYDKTRRHGMPGGGYLCAEAESKNAAGRRRDSGWERWKTSPRPPDTETWTMIMMIEAHQDMVWDYEHGWPVTL
jgi:alkylated DNA nucleotide flippase Atl1